MRIIFLAFLFVVTGVSAQTREELWIDNGSRHIFGILNKPAEKAQKHPLVIIVHGFNGTHDWGCNYFDMLASMGYACYTFDFPNGSVGSRSGNNTMEMSVLDEQRDLEAIVAYFRRHPDIDANRIVLVGESQGGLVAALAAANKPDDIYRLILVFPAIGLGDSRDTRPAESMPDTTRVWGVPLGKRFYLELRDVHAFDRIGRYDKPVLILQGDADRVVPLASSERAAKIYTNARLHVIRGAGHGFKPEEFQESLEQIKAFLGNY
ncbi:MAG: alpha/beta fold hydrolase [Bacteroidaceae bacterium]|nr:alpha/beta fold hydrolase [Bacteroidaceae bacterium]